MDCGYIACSYIKICVMECWPNVSKGPSENTITCSGDDEITSLPCPLADEITCCNLTEITGQCLCGTCTTTETQTKSSNTETNATELLTSAFKTAITTPKAKENDTFPEPRSYTPRMVNYDHLAIIILSSLTVTVVLIVLGLLIKRQLKAVLRRRNRRQRPYVLHEFNLAEELQHMECTSMAVG